MRLRNRPAERQRTKRGALRGLFLFRGKAGFNAATECLTDPERNRIIRAESGPPMIKRERITAGIYGPKSIDEKGEEKYVYL